MYTCKKSCIITFTLKSQKNMSEHIQYELLEAFIDGRGEEEISY